MRAPFTASFHFAIAERISAGIEISMNEQSSGSRKTNSGNPPLLIPSRCARFCAVRSSWALPRDTPGLFEAGVEVPTLRSSSSSAGS